MRRLGAAASTTVSLEASPGPAPSPEAAPRGPAVVVHQPSPPPSDPSRGQRGAAGGAARRPREPFLAPDLLVGWTPPPSPQELSGSAGAPAAWATPSSSGGSSELALLGCGAADLSATLPSDVACAYDSAASGASRASRPRTPNSGVEGTPLASTSPSRGEQEADIEDPRPGIFLVDNRLLKAETLGLGFRRSKRLDDHGPELGAVPWGTCIRGTDLRDGWLQVGHLYLPTVVRGIAVLLPQPAGDLYLDFRAANGPRSLEVDHVWVSVVVEGQRRQTPPVPSSCPAWRGGAALALCLAKLQSEIAIEVVGLGPSGSTCTLGELRLRVDASQPGQWHRRCEFLEGCAGGRRQLDFAFRWELPGAPTPPPAPPPLAPEGWPIPPQRLHAIAAGMQQPPYPGAHGDAFAHPRVALPDAPTPAVSSSAPFPGALATPRSVAAPSVSAEDPELSTSMQLAASLRRCHAKLSRGGVEAASAAAEWLAARQLLVHSLAEAEQDFEHMGLGLQRLEGELKSALSECHSGCATTAGATNLLEDGTACSSPRRAAGADRFGRGAREDPAPRLGPGHGAAPCGERPCAPMAGGRQPYVDGGRARSARCQGRAESGRRNSPSLRAEHRRSERRRLGGGAVEARCSALEAFVEESRRRRAERSAQTSWG